MITLNAFNPRELNPSFRESVIEEGAISPDTVVLSTCQRLELYSGQGTVPFEIANHLFCLAAGLKSNIPGDGHVLAQIKKAYTNAAASKKLDKNLHRLFQKALHAGKHARSKTNIARGAVSYAQAALAVLNTYLKADKTAKIIIIGVNPITKGIIRMFKKQGMSNIVLINRSLHKCKAIANQENIHFDALDSLQKYMRNADAVLSCTSAGNYLIDENILPVDKEMVLIDLAVPPDIDPNVKNNDNHTLFTIDDVEQHIQSSLLKRSYQIAHVEKIVARHVADFMKWQQKNTLTKEYAA